MSEAGQLQNYSVDQVAGAIVLVLGAVAGLLQVIWMSKCHCRVNLCWIFSCERKPPTEEEMKTLKDSIQDKKDKMKKDKEDKAEKALAEQQEEQILPRQNSMTPNQIP
tara:strand:+ start:386 stop:709 length:324 start_codon:yes stop_codon:yes gene_type:complete